MLHILSAREWRVHEHDIYIGNIIRGDIEDVTPNDTATSSPERFMERLIELHGQHIFSSSSERPTNNVTLSGRRFETTLPLSFTPSRRRSPAGSVVG